MNKFHEKPELQGTKETQPWHLWLHEVELAALRNGADETNVRSPRVHSALVKAFQAQEPAWMAVDVALQLCRGLARARREQQDGSEAISRALKSKHGSDCDCMSCLPWTY